MRLCVRRESDGDGGDDAELVVVPGSTMRDMLPRPSNRDVAVHPSWPSGQKHACYKGNVRIQKRSENKCKWLDPKYSVL